jgi:UDP-glucuronate 4-epimerase
MRILITGAGGFIGTNLLKFYEESGHDIHAVDPILPNNCYGATKHKERIQNTCLIKTLQPDIIIHLAGYSGVRMSDDIPLMYMENNVCGTVHVFEEAKKNGVNRIIYASSSSVYGEEPCQPEDSLFGRQKSMYALTKYMKEQVADYYYLRFGVRSIGLRFFTVYGPHGRTNMAIGGFTKAMLEETPITIFGDGSQRRDYTYVDDVVESIDLCTISPHITCNTADVGAGQSYSVMELVNILTETLGITPEIEYIPKHEADVAKTLSDNRALFKLTGYIPAVSFREGISKYIDWLKSQNQNEQPYCEER